MAVQFHTGTFSPKEAETLVGDIHWNAKKLIHQAGISYHLVKDIKDALKKLMNRGTSAQEKERLEEELTLFLERLEQFSNLEEREELLVAKESAAIQTKILNDMKKHIRDEVAKLLGSRSIPRSASDAIFKKVGGDIKDIKKDIKKQAKIAVEVGGRSASFTLQSMGAITPSEVSAAKKEKKVSHKAKGEFDIIEAIEERLKKDENAHEIDKIKNDLINEAHEDEKEIHYIYVNVLYCLLFMNYIEKRFEELEDVMKQGRKHPDVKGFIEQLEKKLDEIKKGWAAYMDDIKKVLQQLRFSVAPAEETRILKAAT